MKPILVCSDGSELSLAALRAGLTLIGPDNELLVVTVKDAPDPMLVTGTGLAGGVVSPLDYERMIDAAAAEAADTAALTELELNLYDAEIRILDGPAGPSICHFAEQVSAKAIVIGSRGRGGLKRAVLGSVSDHVVRHAPCPVIVTSPHGP